MKSFDELMTILEDQQAFRILSCQYRNLEDQYNCAKNQIVQIDDKLSSLKQELAGFEEEESDDFEVFSPISNDVSKKEHIEQLQKNSSELLREKESLESVAGELYSKMETVSYLLTYMNGLKDGIMKMKEEYDRLAESMWNASEAGGDSSEVSGSSSDSENKDSSAAEESTCQSGDSSTAGYPDRNRLQLCHDIVLSDPYRVRVELEDLIRKL